MQFLDTARMSFTSTAPANDFTAMYHRELELGKKAIAVANSVQTPEQSVVAMRYLERVILQAQIPITVDLVLRKMAHLRLKFYQPKVQSNENSF